MTEPLLEYCSWCQSLHLLAIVADSRRARLSRLLLRSVLRTHPASRSPASCSTSRTALRPIRRSAAGSVGPRTAVTIKRSRTGARIATMPSNYTGGSLRHGALYRRPHAALKRSGTAVRYSAVLHLVVYIEIRERTCSIVTPIWIPVCNVIHQLPVRQILLNPLCKLPMPYMCPFVSRIFLRIA